VVPKRETLALAGVICIISLAANGSELTLDQAVTLAFERSALLRAEDAAVNAVRHQAALDGLSPTITVGAEFENAMGTGAVSGVRSAETTLRLGRVFELGGKRAARQQIGVARVELQANERAKRKLDLAAEVTRRYIEVVSKQARLALSAQSLVLSRETVETMAYRVKRGRSSASDLALAELSVTRAELERESAAHELDSARVNLSVLWGEIKPDFEQANGTLDDLPETPALAALAERLLDTPAQRAYALESAQIDAQTRLAAASRRPDIQTTVGVRRLEALDDQGLVLSVSLPFGLDERASLAVDKQRAERERVDSQRINAELTAYAVLHASYQELQHARHEVEALRERMIPTARKALAATQAGYDEARFSFLQVAQVRAVLLGLQNDQIQAAARYHQTLAEIERVTALSGVLNP